MPAITPALWFRADAEPAVRHYVSLFPNSRIGAVVRGGPGGPVVAIEFELDGHPFLAINGRPADGFTDAHSFLIPCDTQEEIDRYWAALTADGGAEGQCGWLTDRFGVSWQVAPRRFAELVGGPDAAAAARAMQAMMQMKKLDIAALERARAAA
jgi:predicted 3-demethylubiquinone-9 3-methyltransferase (glyoxalase superfamily)